MLVRSHRTVERGGERNWTVEICGGGCLEREGLVGL